MRLADFDYELPSGCIAQEPLAERDRARLFVHERERDRSDHREVRELATLLRAGDLLVVNDTRVIPARLLARRASGGRIELLLVEPVEPVEPGEATWSAMVHPARRLREGERLALEGGALRVCMLARTRLADGSAAMTWNVRFEDLAGAPVDPRQAMEQVGHVPLPPYVERGDDARDAERYQTVYARSPGAVAAPTAGLHFTPALLAELEAHGIERTSVTLHVGPGTFQPVKSENVLEHRMHAERFVLPESAVTAVRAARARGGRVIAVGTTVVRVLESRAGDDGVPTAGEGTTRLFLHPGARFRVVDGLLTNFHLPRSTLLMLVCAFAGRERVLRLYREAVERGYRFYSYGDAQLYL